VEHFINGIMSSEMSSTAHLHSFLSCIW